MRPAVAFLIFSLIAPVIAQAQDVASLEQMRQAAQQGDADAQLDMGILYEFGYNLPQNDATALAWYMRAADQGNTLAVQRRDLLKTRMKPEEVDAAEKLAAELAMKKTEAVKTSPATDNKSQNVESSPSPAAPAAADEPPAVPAPRPQAAEPSEATPPAPEPAAEKPSS